MAGPLHILLLHLRIQLHQHITAAAHKWTTQPPGPPTFVNVEQACVEIVNRTSAHCASQAGPLNARQQPTGEECFMVMAISHKAIACYSWAQPCIAMHSSISVSTNHSYVVIPKHEVRGPFPSSISSASSWSSSSLQSFDRNQYGQAFLAMASHVGEVVEVIGIRGK